MLKNVDEMFRFLDKIVKSDSDYSLAKVLNQVYLCVETEKPGFTDFLDPGRRQTALHVLGPLARHGMFMAEEGGYPEAERKVLGFGARELGPGDFPISRLKLEYDARYGAISHRDVLGALLNLGLSRDVVGDVVILAEGAVVLVEEGSRDFVLNGLSRVGCAAVGVEALPADAVFFGLDNRVVDRIVCASLRLDAVLAAAFKLSRARAAALVKSGKGFVNWREERSASKQVKEGDVLTLRRFGRVKVQGFGGKSRKERYLIDITRYSQSV